jgi:hypothetical protein
MRAWLDVLRERHPEVSWIPATDGASLEDEPPSGSETDQVGELLAA